MGNEINPQIRAIKIGVRDLREISILPLSIGDQGKLSDIISKAIKTFVDSGKAKLQDEAFIGEVLELVSKNIGSILELIVDDKVSSKRLLNEITNKQALNIAEIVYEENYADIVKKVQGLIEMTVRPNSLTTGDAMSILGKLQPISSEDTPSTELKISSGNLGETGG